MLKILFWPLSLAGWLIQTILSIVGSLLGFFVGLAMADVGIMLCKTFILAILGVPLVLLGGGLMLKSLF